jgi:hypothetical protein
MKKVQELEKKVKDISKQTADETKKCETMEDQMLSVREAAKSSVIALSKLPNDPAIKEVTEKLEMRNAELSSACDVAAKRRDEALGTQKAAENELNAAQSALSQAIREKVKRDALLPLEQAHLSATTDYESAIYAMKAIEQKLAVCQLAEEYASLREAESEKAEAVWQSLVQLWTNRNQIAALKPLTPEQLAMSMLRATGSLAARIDSAKEKLRKSPPAAMKNAGESEKAALEERLMQGMLIDELRGTVNQFVGLYGGLLGEDFQATVNQALFFGNGAVIDGLLKPTNDNLTQRLSGMDDPYQIADELYLAILSRPADKVERSEIAAVLSSAGPQKTNSIRELCWALLSSNEFRFNH